MDKLEPQAAMDWIVARAQQLGQEWGVDLTPLGWERRVSNVTTNRHRLIVQLKDRRSSIIFEDATLVDLPRNVLRQVIVDARLRLLLRESRDTRPLTA